MKCIVPLAGPDLYTEKWGLRPLVQFDGKPLIEYALKGRPWFSSLDGSDFYFVVRDVEEVGLLEGRLRLMFPGCYVVRLPHLTGGAMFTALAGVSLTSSTSSPIVIDLADMIFSDWSADLSMPWPKDVGALFPTFTSADPRYSYLREVDGVVVEAAEKQVISNIASVGVYIFKDQETFVSAAAYSIKNRARLTVFGAQFVCPMANGVIADGQKVVTVDVQECRPIGDIFK